MRFALIGQPNCGKSTLFNQVAGYKAETGNFTGTTVTFTESRVRVLGEVIELVDLPGTYTLTGSNPAERETLSYLGSHQVDLIINILDATRLAQGMTLSLELLELQLPTIIAVNMMDEAARVGINIDGNRLQQVLGVDVVPLVANKGRGVKRLFITALESARKRQIPQRLHYCTDLESAVHSLAASIDGTFPGFTAETTAIKLLESNNAISDQVYKKRPDLHNQVKSHQAHLQARMGQEAAWVISGERHTLAGSIAKSVVQQGKRNITWRDRLDDILLHPLWGYLTLFVILLVFFEIVYGIGRILEKPLLDFFNQLNQVIINALSGYPFIAEIASGLLQGIAGGFAIVLPYLVPFLLGLGFLEDVGYLPRVAFLMDALMHRMGLHGKAVVPFILGYGCNVPAVMSTRMLEDRRDRYLAATLATLVPCAARLAVVFGLVAFYLGPLAALAIYLFNLVVIAITGKVLSGLLPEDTPGMILEMPVYRLPTLRTVTQKTWFRAREFIVEAWPVLIVGSIILSVMIYFNLTVLVNIFLLPLTWILGLPSEVGVPLVFGILRKELSLIMLRQALGASDFGEVLTPVQMITFSVFVVFYVPCLATLTVIKRELGRKDMFTIAGLTVIIATIAAMIARIAASLWY
jgi:ferrous iron transport protein B